MCSRTPVESSRSMVIKTKTSGPGVNRNIFGLENLKGSKTGIWCCSINLFVSPYRSSVLPPLHDSNPVRGQNVSFKLRENQLNPRKRRLRGPNRNSNEHRIWYPESQQQLENISPSLHCYHLQQCKLSRKDAYDNLLMTCTTEARPNHALRDDAVSTYCQYV